MLRILPSLVARAQVSLTCAQYDAAWLGEGRQVNRNSSGQFSSGSGSSSNLSESMARQANQQVIRLAEEVSEADQKAAAKQWERLEEKALKETVRTKLGERGLLEAKEIFDVATTRLQNSLEAGTLKQEIESLLKEFNSDEFDRVGVWMAIAYTLSSIISVQIDNGETEIIEAFEQWVKQAAQGLDKQEQKALMRSLFLST